MATNVTEKDKTLNEVIAWCEQKWADAENDSVYFPIRGQAAKAYAEVIDHCQSQLGYSGSMPSEVPNQSEGREMSSQYKVCPLFWTDRGSDRRLVNMEALEELLNEGWQILRVDTMPPTELRNNAVTATNVYILEREANDD